MLLHIQGTKTSGWKHDMGELLNSLDPAIDNIPALWDQFLVEFRTQFQDTQWENRVRTQIETHHMKFPDIDQYIVCYTLFDLSFLLVLIHFHVINILFIICTTRSCAYLITGSVT